jgi:hypothetical protein
MLRWRRGGGVPVKRVLFATDLIERQVKDLLGRLEAAGTGGRDEEHQA